MNILDLIFLQTADAPSQDLIAAKVEKTSSFIESLKGLSLTDALEQISQSLVRFAFNLAIAILVFYVGKLIIKKLYAMTRNVMVHKHIDPSLTTFILSLERITLYFILIIVVVGILGIETSSFLALFASAGVAVGLALSGTLQNFAGGVLILLLKPYKVGDYIEAQGYAGTVKEIQIFHTIINTIDNKSIIIPNGGLSTSSINNYSREDYRRVDWTVCLAYGTDYDKASKAILEILDSDTRVVKHFIEDDRILRLTESHAAGEDVAEKENEIEEHRPSWFRRLFRRKKRAGVVLPSESLEQAVIPQKIDRAPFVALGEMADSSINLTVRAWTASSNYWGLFFDMNKRFYTELPAHGFSFPFPQMDVHINPQS